MDGFGASICRFFGMANLLMVWNLDVVSDIIADATNGGQAAEGTLERSHDSRCNSVWPL